MNAKGLSCHLPTSVNNLPSCGIVGFGGGANTDNVLTKGIVNSAGLS